MVSWWFIGWIIALLLTPGPTNTLLASSGLRVGIAKSFPLIPAEAFGYLISISLWGFAVGILSQHLYMLPDFLKLFSAIYIAYLASQLWRSSSNPDNEQPIKIGARQLFIATLLNPKAVLFASAIFPSSVWYRADIYVAHMLIFLLILIPIAFIWTCLGASLAKNQSKWLTQSRLQQIASVVLLVFALPLGYSALRNLA